MKDLVTILHYKDNVLEFSETENRVIYEDKKGEFIRYAGNKVRIADKDEYGYRFVNIHSKTIPILSGGAFMGKLHGQIDAAGRQAELETTILKAIPEGVSFPDLIAVLIRLLDYFYKKSLE